MRNIAFPLLALFLMTGIVTNSIPYAAAQQSDQSQACGTTEFDCYQESGFRLTSNPVICMNSPPDPNYATKVEGYAVGAVQEWSNLLNGGGSRHPLWDMRLIPIATSDVCNIVIEFVPYPSSDMLNQGVDAAGMTELDNYTHTAKIQIYYDAVGFNADGTPYYSNETAPDYQIPWALRHELGHALGLGHYILSNAENQAWQEGTLKAPSIMLPDMGGLEVYTSAITQMDIEKIKSLYDSGGFGGHASQQINPIIPSIPSPEMSSSDISYWMPQIRNYFENGTNSLTSSDYASNVLNLVDLLDSEHLSSIPDPVGNQTGIQFRMYMQPWLANDISFWAQGEITDSDLASTMQYLYNNGMFYFQT